MVFRVTMMQDDLLPPLWPPFVTYYYAALLGAAYFATIERAQAPTRTTIHFYTAMAMSYTSAW